MQAGRGLQSATKSVTGWSRLWHGLGSGLDFCDLHALYCDSGQRQHANPWVLCGCGDGGDG